MNHGMDYVTETVFPMRPAFNLEKPGAQEIFYIVLIDAAKFEEIRPLKGVRGD